MLGTTRRWGPDTACPAHQSPQPARSMVDYCTTNIESPSFGIGLYCLDPTSTRIPSTAFGGGGVPRVHSITNSAEPRPESMICVYNSPPCEPAGRLNCDITLRSVPYETNPSRCVAVQVPLLMLPAASVSV